MQHQDLFAKFEPAIRAFRGDATAPTLLLEQEGALASYYAPFDTPNPGARLVLVGITPGKSQAATALAIAQKALAEGVGSAQAKRLAKGQAAFSGPMRANLEAMLETVGVPAWLGLASAQALFNDNGGILHTMSVLPFPVVRDGENYKGSPSIERTPFLRNFMAKHFTAQVESMPQAVFLPLGPVVAEALGWLVTAGKVDKQKVLPSLPHPSPANNERIQFFCGTSKKEAPSSKTNLPHIRAMRDQLCSAVAALKSTR